MESDCIRRLRNLTREEGFAEETDVNELINTAREVLAEYVEVQTDRDMWQELLSEAVAAHSDAMAAAKGERDALHAIIEGRTVAPTDAEIEAHADAGGTWAITEIDDPRGVVRTRLVLEAQVIAQRQREQPRRVLRWIALGADGKPCTWPVVSEVNP